MQHVKTYFDTYPEKNEVFETSDSFLFHKATDAQNHAVTLKDKDVATHKRKDQLVESNPAQIKRIEPAKPNGKPEKEVKPAKPTAKAIGEKLEGEKPESEKPEGDNAGGGETE